MTIAVRAGIEGEKSGNRLISAAGFWNHISKNMAEQAASETMLPVFLFQLPFGDLGCFQMNRRPAMPFSVGKLYTWLMKAYSCNYSTIE